MNRIVLLIICFWSALTFAQNKGAEERWKEINQGVEYYPSSRKSKAKKHFLNPEGLNNYYEEEEGYTTPADNLNDEEILYNREGQFGPYKGKGGIQKNDAGSTIKDRPKLELDPPDIEPLDVDPPDVQPSRFEVSENIWMIILIVLLVVVVVGLIYFFLIKNVETSDKVSTIVPDLEEWNPEEVTKTELEILLEKAIAEEDYRQCVRIYYTFILQSLIKRGWIKWKQDKTNIHYQMEMIKRPVAQEFNKAVRLYELVWYGHYEINNLTYQSLEPELKSLYKKIDANEGK